MKNISTLFLVFVLLTSCDKKTTNELHGTYKSAKLDFSEKIRFSTNNDIEGMILILKKDSTYFYDTCGILINGSWSVRDDRLTMTVNNIRYKNDSINKMRKPEKRADFLEYNINDNILYGFINNNNGLRINELIKKN